MRRWFRTSLTVVFVLLIVGGGVTSAQQGCSPIYGPTDGWGLDLCRGDANFGDRMVVLVDGKDQGLAAMVRVYHDTEDGSHQPQVAVLNASGFVRLRNKPGGINRDRPQLTWPRKLNKPGQTTINLAKRQFALQLLAGGPMTSNHTRS